MIGEDVCICMHVCMYTQNPMHTYRDGEGTNCSTWAEAVMIGEELLNGDDTFMTDELKQELVPLAKHLGIERCALCALCLCFVCFIYVCLCVYECIYMTDELKQELMPLAKHLGIERCALCALCEYVLALCFVCVCVLCV
jgi:hypothetical protein